MSLLFTKYYNDKDVMDREWSMYGREEECIWNFGGKAKRKETTKKMQM
jgi:hypothetical protein